MLARSSLTGKLCGLQRHVGQQLKPAFSDGVRRFHQSRLRLNDEETQKTLRASLRISDLLKGQREQNFSCPDTFSIGEAIAFLVNEQRSSALVTHRDGSVAGIFTARDLLQFVKDHNLHSQNRSLTERLANTKIVDLMTKSDKMVYCSPSDTVVHARETMFQCKIRNMPVLDGHEIKGIITMKLLADSAFDLMSSGGKKGFISHVTGRRGLPEHSTVSRKRDEELDIEVGSFALPHPFKKPQGVAGDHRAYGAAELADDMSLCEDAHFLLRLRDDRGQSAGSAVNDSPRLASFSPSAEDLEQLAREQEMHLPLAVDVTQRSQVFLCVADGVGSWRSYGVDPRQFSKQLVNSARQAIEEDFEHRASIEHGPLGEARDPIHPLEVLCEAWNRVQLDEVVGSSTICVATLEASHGQLSYSNIGDGGLLVARRLQSNTAGYMHTAQAEVKIAYLSQQQLRSFNLPYQLGYTNIPGTPCDFEVPTDADTASISVIPGDVIVLATDGLFDNVDMQEIVREIAKWQKDYFNNSTELLRQSAQSGAPSGAENKLAERLVRLARELSLDKSRDSPFALLAKENDILWGGGMPDDTTVVVGRIVAVPSRHKGVKY